MGFWGGMAIGVILCFVLYMVFDKPETVINGKNKVKARGNARVDNQFKPKNNTPKVKRKLFKRKK